MVPSISKSARIAALPTLLLFLLIFAAVVLSHLSLLQLPYFWDEGGYYIPAALDFFHTGQLIPHYTNAHPPLPAVLLGTMWHIVGFHILATRLLVCAFASAGLLAIFRLTQRLLDATAAITVTFLTAAYPIWFAQSTLAHADIFAAAFTLWAFALYLPATCLNKPTKETCHPDPEFVEGEGPASRSQRHRYLLTAILFSLAALSKETSIVQPAALAALQIAYLIRDRRNQILRAEHLRWIAALAFPILPLCAWFLYHRYRTGFTFGNPEYLRYNATANFTFGHVFTSLRYRFLHLFWQRNIWLPLMLAVACLFLDRRTDSQEPELAVSARRTIAILIVANWFAFSVLGGALLTRYLLPIYPLILIVCIAIWRTHTKWWPAMVALTSLGFISALWVNPPTSFAPEDNLTYRDMIVVDQEAIDFVAQHYPSATTLTAWPVAADLFNPYLGYVQQPMKAISIEDFTLPQIRKAAQEEDRYDTAIVFTTHFTTPSFRRWLLAHPDSARGREFEKTRDLTPAEIAAMLGGRIVWQDDRNGEWAAVIRFNRSYEAGLLPTRLIP